VGTLPLKLFWFTMMELEPTRAGDCCGKGRLKEPLEICRFSTAASDQPSIVGARRKVLDDEIGTRKVNLAVGGRLADDDDDEDDNGDDEDGGEER
jgi:hypothetical protein